MEKQARSLTFHNRDDAGQWATKQESMIHFAQPTLQQTGLTYCRLVLAGKPSRTLTELQFNRIGKIAGFANPLEKVVT